MIIKRKQFGSNWNQLKDTWINFYVPFDEGNLLKNKRIGTQRHSNKHIPLLTTDQKVRSSTLLGRARKLLFYGAWKGKSMAATLKEAKKLIKELDLTPMIERVMKEKRWTRRMTEVAAGFYRNFLYLSKKYPEENLSPTRQIDELWHAHILYTKDYHEICEKIFGYYLHHQPLHEEEKGESSKEGGIKFLQKLHEKEFGTSIYDAVYSLKDIHLFIRKHLSDLRNKKYIF